MSHTPSPPQQPSIAILEPYFGAFPPWHNLFLQSLAGNRRLRWIVFTDAPVPPRHPDNVSFVRMSLAELNALCERKLGFNPALTRGFKACDLRPAFGKLFEDHLTGFSHWGYGDSDVLWGKLDRFVSDDHLARYDALASCRCTITGQFTVFRNSGPFQHPHTFIPDYAKRVRDPASQYLDEQTTNDALVAAGARILHRQLQIHDKGSEEWRLWAEKLELADKGHLDEHFWEGGNTAWHQGHILHAESGKEALFFHFPHFKRQWKLPRYPYWPERIKNIHCSEQGIRLEFHSPALLHAGHFHVRYQLPHLLRQSVRTARDKASRVMKRLSSKLRK